MTNLRSNMYEWMQYSQYIFNRFNGTINTVFPARSIVLGTPHPRYNGVVLGSLIVDEVNIHLIDIANFCDKFNIVEDDKIRTLIVFTILHELSHCDQDIDFRLTKNDRRETLRYEIENDYNTLQFMYNIADVLPQICHGNLNQYMLEMMIHKEPIIPFKEKILYRKILSPHDKIIKILSNIVDEDIYPIIVNERIQYIKVAYRRFNDVMIRELDIMKYGHWLPLSDSTILKEIVRSSHIVSKIFITPMRELLIDVEQISPESVM